MRNAINFVKAMQGQTSKQRENTEQMNGLLANLLSDRPIRSYYDYMNMIHDLKIIAKETSTMYPETRTLIDNLAEIIYQLYVLQREKLVNKHTRLSDTLANSNDYQTLYDDFKSSVAYDDDKIAF